MKLLIIGGTGVISTAVVAECLKENISITCINRGRNKLRKNNEGCEVIYSDVNDVDKILSFVGENHFDAVIDFISFSTQNISDHLAWLHKICDKYIFISSTAVYNQSIDSDFSEDSVKVNQQWLYSINKWKCEELVVKLCKEYGITYTILRPSVTYDNTRIPYGIMPPYGKHWTLVSRILNNKPIVKWDNGEYFCTATRVEDFAKATAKLITNSQSDNEAFNIVGDVSENWSDILNTIGCVIGVKPTAVYLSPLEYKTELKNNEITGRLFSKPIPNIKLKSIVPDFKSTISLKEGIEKTINHYKENNYLNGIDYVYDGIHDRIVAKYHKEYKDKCKFIDYLGNATIHDRIDYTCGYYNNYTFIKVTFNFLRKMLTKLRDLNARSSSVWRQWTSGGGKRLIIKQIDDCRATGVLFHNQLCILYN
ncbi:MAG: NAD-dependent epimerase/dehydratase family protein [Rikenellaceae bacterium]